MKIAVVAESFLPTVNGVTRSVLEILQHFSTRGHDAVVIAPRPALGAPVPASYAGAPIVWLPSVSLPSYRTVRLSAVGVRRMRSVLARTRPDVVHLAAPFVLGWDAVRAANQLGLPSVAVFQTDVPSYAGRYGVAGLEPLLWRRVRDIHGAAGRTLAPSSSTGRQLRENGVPRVHRWARGVDAELFHPGCRDESRRAPLAPQGQVLVGYVGRLAAEKQVADLRVLDDLPGVRLVIIGDGPLRPRLERQLPNAVFLGWRAGPELATAIAGLDLVVHPGEHDTFGQTIQETMACGVPTVAVGVGGPVDLVTHGTTGFLYPRGDLAAMRDQVAALAADPELRGRFGRAARRLVADRSWSRLGDRLLEQYREVLCAHEGDVDSDGSRSTEDAVAA